MVQKTLRYPQNMKHSRDEKTENKELILRQLQKDEPKKIKLIGKDTIKKQREKRKSNCMLRFRKVNSFE